MVFYHGVWLQDIGTDLVSPADICHFASNAGKLLLGFLLFQQIQLGLQHLHGLVLVHVLRTFILALYHDSCREMGDTDRRGCLVDMLSTGTTASVGIDTDIIVIDLYVQILLDIRHNIAGYK